MVMITAAAPLRILIMKISLIIIMIIIVVVVVIATIKSVKKKEEKKTLTLMSLSGYTNTSHCVLQIDIFTILPEYK